jgi:hypothetical protein
VNCEEPFTGYQVYFRVFYGDHIISSFFFFFFFFGVMGFNAGPLVARQVL